MIIVHLIDYFQPKVGYQEYFLAREQQKMGHQVFVVTSNYYYPFPNYEKGYKKILGRRLLSKGLSIEEGVSVERLPSWEIMPGRLIILLTLKTTFLKLNPDVVFCHNLYSATSYMAAYLKVKVGYRLIYDTHASYFNTNFKADTANRLYHALFHKFAVSFIKEKADSIFAIGEEERSFLASDFEIVESKIPIIRLGVDIERFRWTPQKKEGVRKKLYLDNNTILCIYAGKITPNKDVHILAQALGKTKQANYHLLVIGSGRKEYITSLKESIPHKVTFLPMVPNEDLSSFYSASDIGIWPGDPSITMLEAMACKVPLIVPDDKQTAYLKESRGVEYFERGNISHLQEKLENLIKNDTLRKKLAKNAQVFVRNQLSWRIISKKTLELMKNE